MKIVKFPVKHKNPLYANMVQYGVIDNESQYLVFGGFFDPRDSAVDVCRFVNGVLLQRGCQFERVAELSETEAGFHLHHIGDMDLTSIDGWDPGVITSILNYPRVASVRAIWQEK